MSAIGPTEDDIHQLRRDGDLGAYLRGLIRHSRAQASARDGPAPTGYGPHHTPGAWPSGTHPQTSTICRPNCGCAPHEPTT